MERSTGIEPSSYSSDLHEITKDMIQGEAIPSTGRVEEWRHTRRFGLSVAPRFLWERHIIDREPIFRWERTHRSPERFSRRKWGRLWLCRRSVGLHHRYERRAA